MSTNLRGVVDIELKSDRFTNPARQAGREFDSLGQKGKTALGGISLSSKNATTDVKVLGTSGNVAFQSLGTAAATAGVQVKRTAAELNASRAATLGMAGSVAGLAASFVGLEASISNIPKRLNNIEKAEVGLARAQDLVANKTLALQKQELTLEKARSQGKKTAEEINILEEKITNTRQQLVTATDDLTVKQEDLNLKHSDYQDTLKLFITSIATTALTAFTSIAIILGQAATQADLTTGAFVRTRFAALGTTRAFQILAPNIKGARLQLQLMSINLHTSAVAFRAMNVSAQGARIGIHGVRFALVGLRAGIKALYVALGPIGWALIGLTAAYEVLATNAFGARDALVEFAEWLENIFPLVQGISEAIRTFFPTAEEELQKMNDEAEQVNETFGDMEGAAGDAALAVGDFTDAANPNNFTGTVSELDQMKKGFEEITKLLQGEGVQAHEEYVESLLIHLQSVKDQGLDPMSAEYKMAFEQIETYVTTAGETQLKYFGKDSYDNLKRQVNEFGLGTEKVFRGIEDSVKSAGVAVDDLKKNYDKTVREITGQPGTVFAGFLEGGSRITLAQYLRSEFFGQGGQRHVQGTTISQRSRDLYATAGINLGGDNSGAIANALRYAQSIQNAPPAQGRTGQRTNNNRIRNRNYSRQLSSAQGIYEEVFGERATTGYTGGVRGYLAAIQSQGSYARQVRDQLDAFPIPTNLKAQLLETIVGHENISGDFYSFDRGQTRYNANYDPGQATAQGDRRRVRLYGTVGKYGVQREIIQFLVREPTYKEAVLLAFEESKRVEEIFDEINATNRTLSATIAGLREDEAREKLEQEQERIREFARNLEGTQEAEEAVIDVVKSWLGSEDGEIQLENKIKYRSREREHLNLITV